MKYCENCGSKLEENSVFCEACGTKVEASEVETTEETTTRTTKKAERKPLTKKQRMIGAGIIALILFIFIGYNVGTTVYSEENQTNRITEALASKDAAKIADVVTTEDPNFEINAENLEGFVAYLDQNPNYLSELIRGLETSGRFESFNIQQNGTKLGLFDSYNLVMTPVYGTVYTNAKDVVISLGDEELLTSDSEEFAREIGPFAPGIHTFTAAGTLNGFPLTVTEEVVWLDSSQQNGVNLNLQGSHFTVQSDLESATVFIDGESIGQLEDGYGEFGPIQIQDGMELHVGQTFGDEEITSEVVELQEGTTYYEFYDLVMATERDVSNLLNNVYSAANTVSRNYESSNVDNFNGYFYPEGPAYEEQRTALLKELENASNNEDIHYIRFDVTVNEVERVGANSFDVSYEVSTITNYSYQASRDNGLKHYAIDATVTFEPTNHPNRDFDSFIYEISNQELLYEEGHGDSSEETAEVGSSNVDAETSAVVTNFVKSLPTAVNEDNFQAIASYIDPESGFYNEQSSFVSNTHKQGITERLDSVEILEATKNDDGTAKVKTSEAFTIYNGDSESQSKYEATYNLKNVDGKFLITSLTIN